MTLCTPCWNYEHMERVSDIKYTPSLSPTEQCGKCGDDYTDERAHMDLHDGQQALTFDEYQEASIQTAQGDAHPVMGEGRGSYSWTAMFLALAINGEAGELAEKVKKGVRENDREYLREAEDEIGDILWYVSQFASLRDVSLGDVAEGNLDKLLDRQERGQITGKGDYR